MIAKLLVSLDKIAAQALREAVQPLSTDQDASYTLGLRVGVAAGIARARQQIIDFYAQADAKDGEL